MRIISPYYYTRKAMGGFFFFSFTTRGHRHFAVFLNGIHVSYFKSSQVGVGYSIIVLPKWKKLLLHTLNNWVRPLHPGGTTSTLGPISREAPQLAQCQSTRHFLALRLVTVWLRETTDAGVANSKQLVLQIVLRARPFPQPRYLYSLNSIHNHDFCFYQ